LELFRLGSKEAVIGGQQHIAKEIIGELREAEMLRIINAQNNGPTFWVIPFPIQPSPSERTWSARSTAHARVAMESWSRL
jgi:hypothetical protein